MIVECRVPELQAAVCGLTQGLDGLERAGGPTFQVEQNEHGELLLRRCGELIGVTRSAGALLGALELALDAECPRLLAGRSVFHAAVLAAPAGAILIAGRSRAGKSTLAMALVARGLGYMTDDAAIVEEDGSITPYPRRMGLRPGTLELVGPLGDRFRRITYELEDRPPADYLVPTPEATTRGSSRVLVVAFLERRGDTFAFEARSVSAAESAARLLSHAQQRDDPGRDLSRAVRVVADARARLVVTGGSPCAIADALLAALL